MTCRIAAPLCLLLLAAALPAAAQDVVYSKQGRFRIPYHSDPAEMQRLGAREIHLYVSTDRGLSWRQGQAVPPAAGKFNFEAPADGEYWFSVRTLDGGGRLHPPGNVIVPGLKVAVDSQNPDLALALDRSGPQVRLSWRASDVNLDASTLRLEFQQAGGDWQPVHVVAQPAGQTSWTAPAAGVVSVRGEVADRAGNVGVGRAELRIGDAGYAPLPANPELEGPIAGHVAPPAVTPFRNVSERNDLPVPPAGEPVPQIVGRGADGAVAEAPRGEVGPTPIPQRTPAQKFVNTPHFNVNYQLDDVGTSGIAAVEFFITEDGGQKWFLYGPDPDAKSPFRIDVTGEGTYGFQIRARSGAGLAAAPPRPGDAPSVSVTVDQTPPTVALQPPAQVAGPQGPVVQVRWTTTDAHPATAAAIDLEHAPTPDGPWTPIARGLEDAGGYDWPARDLPAAPLYLRLTARDAAGNPGQAVTAQPLVVDLARPTARIVDVGIDPAPVR